MKRITLLLALLGFFISCNKDPGKNIPETNTYDFNPASLNPDMLPVKKVSCQVLYLPVYSNVPYQIDTLKFDMSSFVAVHNTDFYRKIFL